jgi:hypothetical protein
MKTKNNTLRSLIRNTLCETPEELAALDEIIKAKQAEIVGLQKQKAAIQKADQLAAQNKAPAQTQPVQNQAPAALQAPAAN